MPMAEKSNHSIMELAGILSDEEAEMLKKHIKKRRKASRERMNRIRELLRDI